MKWFRSKWLVILFSVGVCVCGFLISDKASALNCSNYSYYYTNPSIANACYNYYYGGGTAFGMMWINNSSSPSDLSSTVEVNSQGDTDVYIHGAVLGNGSNAYASYIKFVKSKYTISGTADGFSEYAPLDLSYNYMNRYGVAGYYGTLSSFTMEAKLDVDLLISDSAYYDTVRDESDGSKTYTVTLQAFRCYGYGFTYPSYGNVSCYSDSSVLEINIKKGVYDVRTTFSNATSLRGINNTSNGGTYGYIWNKRNDGGVNEANSKKLYASSTAKVNFNFGNTITRTDDSINTLASKANYTRVVHYKLSDDDEVHCGWTNQDGGCWEDWSKKFDVRYFNFSKGTKTRAANISFEYTLKPGQWIRACERIYSSSIVDYLGSSGYKQVASKISNWVCGRAIYPKMTVEGINIYNDADLNDADIAVAAQGAGEKSVERVDLYTKTVPYHFICWKEKKSSGKNDCITNTTESKFPYVSGLTGGSYKVYHTKLDDNKTVYAYYAQIYKLTIDAGDGTTITVDKASGVYSRTMGRMSSGASIYKDDKLKICLTVSDGYSLDSFTIKSGSGSASNISPTGTYCTDVSGSQFTVSADTTIVARATREEFYGKSLVSSSSGSWSTSNGVSVADNNQYTQTSGTRTYYIQNCDPVNGCTAKFWHYLKREGGKGGTTYSITRTSNYGSVSSGTVIGTTTETFSGGNEVKEREESFTNKLKPGQVVCETLTFKANAEGNKSLKVCASALGSAQPPDPSDPDGPNGDQAFLNIKVRNDSVTAYNSYRREVYAKPGDSLSYRATYNPILQYAYYLVPEKIKVNGGSWIAPQSGKNSSSYMFTLYNNNKSQLGSGLKDWNNDFAVVASNFTFTHNYPYTNGDTSFQEGINDHKVDMSDVGKGLKETASINSNDAVKTTPSNVIFSAQDIGGVTYNVGNIITSLEPKYATAKVPYNYKNSTSLLTDESTVLYAGENASFSINYTINPKTNSLTTNGGGYKYATSVANPKWKLRAKIGNGDWVETNPVSESRFEVLIDEMENVKTIRKDNLAFNVPDVPAGTQICVQSLVYPASSGNDDNLDANGDGQWAASEQKCYTVAKKPSLQVWGGGVYSSGNIVTAVSAKRWVDGVNMGSYVPSESSPSKERYVFGSWAELSVVANGTITGFASGASMGYKNNNNGSLTPNPTPANGSGNTGNVVGGSYENPLNFCLRSVLTIANVSCSSTAGGMGSSAIKTADDNKESLIARFVNNDDEEGIIYEEIEADGTVGGVTVESGHTMVINAKNGDMIINDDINFLDNASYTILSDVPKLILYAANIKIACAVNRIDAVLIAENNVDTCYDHTDMKSKEKSNQLKINGSIITDTLTATRTYGASTGANSIVPAEIVNYDSTLYLWGANEADVTNTAKMTTTYTHELSPRY